MLAQNVGLMRVLDWAPRLGLSSYYLAAGAVAQTVWNVRAGRDPAANIADYDLVYYDRNDLSEDGERYVAARAEVMLKAHRPSGDALALDVRNEARVHLWYERRFGRPLAPFESLEHAISTFPTTATSVGVRRSTSGALSIYAPFGLNDLLEGIVRPNKTQIAQDRYEQKVARWRVHWPELTLLSWDETPSASGEE